MLYQMRTALGSATAQSETDEFAYTRLPAKLNEGDEGELKMSVYTVGTPSTRPTNSSSVTERIVCAVLLHALPLLHVLVHDTPCAAST